MQIQMLIKHNSYIFFTIQMSMTVLPIHVPTEERVKISSMVTDVCVQLAILENNAKPVSHIDIFT